VLTPGGREAKEKKEDSFPILKGEKEGRGGLYLFYLSGRPKREGKRKGTGRVHIVTDK